MATLQEDLQAKARAITGTAQTYQGDLHALADLYSAPVGQFDGRMIYCANFHDSSIGTASGALNMFLQNPTRAWHPRIPNVAGKTGSILEPYNLGTLYQDSVGTTPVTAVEQPIGKATDTSGSGNHLIQATGAAKPVYRIGTVNRITYSNDLNNWSEVNGVSSTKNLTGPNGQSNYAWTITDDSATLIEYYRKQVGGIQASTEPYTAQVKILKTTGAQSSYPIIQGVYTGGSGIAGSVVVDTSNGVLYDISGQIADSKSCVLHSSGVWWLVTITKNNDGTNTDFDIRVCAAGSSSLPGGFNAAATGTCGFCEGMVKVGTNHADEYIETTTQIKSNGVGAAYVAFDGLDDNWTCATGGGSTTGFTFQAPIMFEGAAGAQDIWSDACTNTGIKVSRDASNQIVFSGGNGSTYTTVTSAALTVGQVYVVTAKYNGSQLRVRINLGTPVTTAFSTLSAGTAGFTIGKANGVSSNFLNGRIYGDDHVKNYAVSDAEENAGILFWASRAGVTL